MVARVKAYLGSGRPRKPAPTAETQQPLWQRSIGPVFNFAGRISGIVVTLLVVRTVGVGDETVPFFLALALTTFVANGLASTIELQGIADLGESRGRAARSVVLGAILLGAGAMAVALVGLLVASVASDLALRITRYAVVLLPTVPVVCAFNALMGVAIYRGRWLPPAWASAARTVVIVVPLLILLPRMGLGVVPVVMLVGEVVRCLLTAAWIHTESGVEPGLLRRFVRRVMTQLPSAVFGSANPAVDRYVTGLLGVGSVAVLDLADKAQGFVSLAFTQGVLPVLFRGWTRDDHRNDRDLRMKRATWLTVAVGTALAVIGSALITWTAPYVLGSSREHAHALAAASTAFLFGMPAYLGTQVMVRLLILRNEVGWFNVTSVIQLLLNVLLDLLLGPLFGITGIAIATSASMWVGFLLFVWKTKAWRVAGVRAVRHA